MLQVQNEEGFYSPPDAHKCLSAQCATAELASSMKEKRKISFPSLKILNKFQWILFSLWGAFLYRLQARTSQGCQSCELKSTIFCCHKLDAASRKALSLATGNLLMFTSYLFLPLCPHVHFMFKSSIWATASYLLRSSTQRTFARPVNRWFHPYVFNWVFSFQLHCLALSCSSL